MTVDELYDQQAFDVMKRILKQHSNCVDIGAHRGKFLTRIMDLSPHGRHFAFEPIPRLAEYLKKTFPTVDVRQVALSNTTGITGFHHIKNAEGYSGIKLRDVPLEPEYEIIPVEINTVDNIIPKKMEIALIKIDVEGGEYNVLRGAIDTIRRCKPVIIFECGPKALSKYGFAFQDVFDLLTKQCNLTVSTMERWLNGYPGLSESEFVANKKDYMWIAYR